MTIYRCVTCGKPYCKFDVPDKVDDRSDLPTVCPWMTEEPGKKPKYKKAKWSKP
jgi:hypothetical protein